MRSRLLAITLAALLSGCAQMSFKYLSAGNYERAVILYEKGMLIEAKAIAQKIDKDDPDYRYARKLIADINAVSYATAKKYMELGEEFEKAGIIPGAIEQYKKALVYNPVNKAAQKAIERLEGAPKEDLPAVRQASAVLKPERQNNGAKENTKPEKKEIDTAALAGAHLARGKSYLGSGTFQKAIDEFRICLKYEPGMREARELLGKAEKDKDTAVDTHLKKGISHFQREELELAIREWERALELDPENKPAADYKSRAEGILEVLKRIREKQTAM